MHAQQHTKYALLVVTIPHLYAYGQVDDTLNVKVE